MVIELAMDCAILHLLGKPPFGTFNAAARDLLNGDGAGVVVVVVSCGGTAEPKEIRVASLRSDA